MQLRIKKKSDGDAVITLVRADGSSTTGRLGSGGFGAVHDLAHYVVESSVRLPGCFLELISTGWSLGDFEVKGASARLSEGAIVSECIVNQLTNGVFAGRLPGAGDFNWLLGQAVDGVRPGAIVPPIGDPLLAEMQARLADLVARWRALVPGGSLELEYPAVNAPFVTGDQLCLNPPGQQFTPPAARQTGRDSRG